MHRGRSDSIGIRLRGELVEESVPATKEATVFEHLRAGRMELPEVAFAGRAVFPRHFDEAVVEAEIVSDRVLPRRPSFAVVGKLLDDVITYVPQCQHLVGGLRYCHGNECNVGVGWFDVVLVTLRRRRRSLSVADLLAGSFAVRSSRSQRAD